MMTIIDHLKWRYATKKFDDSRLLSHEKIATLKKAFNLTATSYGLQPIKLAIVKNKALQRRLVKDSMDQEQVAQASHVLVFCIEQNIDKAFIESYFKLIKTIRQTPDAILEPFKTFLVDDFEQKEIQQIKEWAVKQAYLAMGNLLTVCAVEGIDACPMEGFTPQAYDHILELDKNGLSSVLVMPIGYRAADDMFAGFKKVRRETEDIILEL
jgi:nitroreductase